MKSIETTFMEKSGTELAAVLDQPAKDGIITLPGGLLGFEKDRHYALLTNPEEAPFLWLKMLERELSFLVVSPFMVLESYEPELSEEDVKFLALEKPEDALIFNIVTVHKDGQATVNLKGPIVVNRRTLTGKQVIPKNARLYNTQQPINLA